MNNLTAGRGRMEVEVIVKLRKSLGPDIDYIEGA